MNYTVGWNLDEQGDESDEVHITSVWCMKYLHCNHIETMIIWSLVWLPPALLAVLIQQMLHPVTTMTKGRPLPVKSLGVFATSLSRGLGFITTTVISTAFSPTHSFCWSSSGLQFLLAKMRNKSTNLKNVEENNQSISIKYTLWKGCLYNTSQHYWC